MNQQLSIEDAIAAGEAAMQRCTDKAEELGFSTDAARAFVLNWLTEYGPTAGACRKPIAATAGGLQRDRASSHRRTGRHATPRAKHG